ncbi:MAG: hypothetical protein HOP29_10110 [Phycisphaerales bacterium]|nr:hypothetical protein [Phycisphaerales bacterium]
MTTTPVGPLELELLEPNPLKKIPIACEWDEHNNTEPHIKMGMLRGIDRCSGIIVSFSSPHARAAQHAPTQ